MLSILKLEGITDERPELVRLEGGSILIGREVEEGLVLDLSSVSRTHSRLFEIDGQWFVADQESTNGTFINAIRLKSGAVKPLRSGDTLQLANYPVRVWIERTGEPDPEPNLTIFRQSEFEVQIPLGSVESFKIGGPGAQISIAGLEDKPPIAEISKSPEGVRIVVHNLDLPLMLNGRLIGEEAIIFDRDEISIGPYHIFVTDFGTEAATPDSPSIFQIEKQEMPVAPPQYKPSPKQISFERAMQLRETGSFGSVSPTGPRMGEMTMSQRFAHTAKMKSVIEPEEEQRFVAWGMIVGGIVLLAIIIALFVL